MKLSHAFNTKNIVTIGFTVVVMLMLALALISVRMVENGQQRLNQVVHINNLKIELISDMRTAARERTICVNKMLHLEDAFARDDVWMQFNKFGNDFVQARQRILELPLSPVETRLLELEQSLTSMVAPHQRSVTDLINQGQTDLAKTLLLETILPGQDRLFLVLSELIQYQKDMARRAADEASAEFNRTLIQMLGLAAGFMLVTILIARYVQRQTLDSERRLFNAKEHAQVTLHSIGEGVICTSLQGVVEELNGAAASLVGLRNLQAIGKPITEVLRLSPEGQPTSRLDPVAQVLRGGGLVTSDEDAILHRPDGMELAVEYTASPIHDRDNRLLGSILVFRDVTKMRVLSSQLSYHARHDGLTGLINRREFETCVTRAIEKAHQYDHESWLCFIDMDQFKIINDTCGHLAGDELLKQVAATLCSRVRDGDLVARLGGDEFAILIHHCDEADALHMVERIREEIQAMPFVWEGKKFGTSTSIGLVPINRNAGSLYEVLSTADSACYLAKEGGRNRVHLHQLDDAAMARRDGEMQWVHRITSALEENRFTLYYQAIVPLASGNRQRCGEILVRMLDPHGNIVPPMAFIPAAERYNLMDQIDRWVIRTTIETLAHRQAPILKDGDWVSINLSAQSLCDESFLSFVLKQLKDSAIDPAWLCFEITETSAIANLARAIEVITHLKDQGCRFALDDFGSGVSSFAYLKNLPVDLVKIDGAFVRDIQLNEINLALVTAINQVGHVMGIRTVAEYVENRKIAVLLRKLGVDFGQGFGIHAPAPLSEALLELNGDSAASA